MRKGCSVDNGFYKRKNLKVIHYDQLPFDDGIFAAVLSSNRKESVDEQAIFRIDLQRLFDKLTRNERTYIKLKVMDGLSDVSIKKKLDITFTNIKEMKGNIRRQIQFSFAV